MMYLGSGKMSYVLISLGLFAILALIGYSLLPYVQARFADSRLDAVNWQNWPQAKLISQKMGAFQVVQGTYRTF